MSGVKVEQVKPTRLLRAGLDFVLEDCVVARERGVLERNVTDRQPAM